VKISKELIPEQYISSDLERLVLIGSDSVRMMAFLSSIEEEWDIHIDDSLINAEFFSNYKYLVKCIKITLQKKSVMR